ncbi:MAG: carbohydrate-binding protein [Byssovorax sp.]
MKTIKRMFGTVSAVALAALCLAPGCVGPESGDDTEAVDMVWSAAKEGKDVTLKGTVVVSVTTYDDHGSYHSEMEYHLQSGPEDSERVRLNFDGEPPSFETGDEISVAGRWQTRNDIHAITVDDTLSIRRSPGVAEAGEGELGQSSQALVTARQPKVHKIAVLLVGKTTTTVAQAQAMIDAYSPGSAAALIGESSGLVDTFEGGGVFSYPSINTSNCTDATLDSIRTAARNAFVAKGNTLASYTNIAYVIGGGNCSFFANGTIAHPGGSGQVETTFADNFGVCSVVAHELGHNLGFYHSGSTACGSSNLYKASRSGCADDEYGNTFDEMGYSGGTCTAKGHYSIMDKRYAGYLSGCEDVTAGGSADFNLSAAEGSCGMRSLRIPIAGESNYYYLEFRKPGAGEFAGAGGQSRVLLNVSNDPAVGAPNPYLLDATPATKSVDDAWLKVGKTYNLPGKVSITVVSIGDVAKIQVTMPSGAGAKCQDNTTPPSSGGFTGSLCGGIAPMTYQAEDRTFQKNCTQSTSAPGYHGTGYMDFGNVGSLVELGNVKVPRYGTYTLTFRYSNGGALARKSNIAVNNQVVGSVQFGSTGGWGKWTTNTISATLKKGINKIRVTSIGAGVNLDEVVITSP